MFLEHGVGVEGDKNVRRVIAECPSVCGFLSKILLAHPREVDVWRVVCFPPIPNLAIVDRGAVVDYLDSVRQPCLAKKGKDHAVQHFRVLIEDWNTHGYPQFVEIRLVSCTHLTRSF